MSWNSLSTQFSYWFLLLAFSFPKESLITIYFLLVQYGIAVNYVGENTSASWNNGGYTNIQMSPFYVIRSGNLDGGNLYNQLSSGVLWSSTIESNAIAYRLDYNNYEITPVSTNNRQYGFPVRCITRDFNFLLVQYGIAVNYVGASANATWSADGYSNIQKIPLFISRSGCFGYPNVGSFFGRASYGYLWSSTTDSSSFAFNMENYSNNIVPADADNRQFGWSVRCINRDFNFLLVQYGIAVNYVGNANATWTTEGLTIIQENPLYIPRSGSFRSGGFYAQASNGYLWSGATDSGTYAYDLYYYSSNVAPAATSNRQSGCPVRCIASYGEIFFI